MTYALQVTRRAQQDINDIFEWLAERSPEGAVRWYDRCWESLNSLRENANDCVLAPESDRLNLDLRQSLFKTRKGHRYRILFVVHDEVVHIVGVRGAGQGDVTEFDIELP